MAGIDTSQNSLKVSWLKNFRPTMQPVVFPESNELVINHYENGEDYIIVLDLTSGELLSKVGLDSRLSLIHI